uniref:Uncharacterized protein n=1 Tax=Anguilla anguilla TaxID=7936 RepID=A0A0E9Y0V1_ANGAN
MDVFPLVFLDLNLAHWQHW